MIKALPFNPVIQSIEYSNQVLKVVFKKKTGLQERYYGNVPKEVGCNFFYKETAKEAIKFFSENIKRKFVVIKIKNI
jgi:hypothetical protein